MAKKDQAGTQEANARGRGTGLAKAAGVAKGKERYFAGTPEEVAARETVGYGDKAPQFSPSAFKVIPGQIATGKHLSDPSFDQRNGFMKFSSGPEV